MKIIIVDENDNEIGIEERTEARKNKRIWRATGLWIKNDRGELLLSRRAWTKEHDPGEWSLSVAGTVDEGETYDSNIKKEAKEELGLVNVDFAKGPKVFFRHNDDTGVFAQFYFLELDKAATDFKLMEEEVAEVRWFPLEEIEAWVKGSAPDFTYMRKRWSDWSRVLKDAGFTESHR